LDIPIYAYLSTVISEVAWDIAFMLCPGGGRRQEVRISLALTAIGGVILMRYTTYDE